ncbi:hypothetical protein DOTSEDRAFT_126111 [Dothistroma septosporum NZE10]|uniref:NmrA-like domain-containing protein n=1 Tax=Dothistroma septosporum (strain NZE10 / CBS 128990) TaxID=675120 RepID=N1PUG8_DOTSN|nr:hypothetical protein DOTSEDRAFT_126111 [Dothistroma septosporum NZE10]
MTTIKVGVVGASGETGSSIVNGLLEAGNFEIIALTRPTSISKPFNLALASRGIIIREQDLSATSDPASLIPAISDLTIIISSIAPLDQAAQIPLATAAKAAGIKRFIPCAYVPVMPAGGTHILRDLKEQVYNHIKTLRLPFTIVDVGWWYQLSIPKLPSGRTDEFLLMGKSEIAGDGNVSSALTDLRDIGKYVARLAMDERAENRYVLVYNEMWTQNEVYKLVEKESGEQIERNYVSKEELEERVASVPEGSLDVTTLSVKAPAQYMLSWGVKGDNTPEYAKYLGYVTSKELYPEMEFNGFEAFVKEVLKGEAPTIYEELKKQFAAAQK